MGVFARRNGLYPRHHICSAVEHILIAHTKHTKTEAREPSISTVVMLELILVIPAVDFQQEIPARQREVSNYAANHEMAAKTILDRRPEEGTQQSLRTRGAVSQLACSARMSWPESFASLRIIQTLQQIHKPEKAHSQRTAAMRRHLRNNAES